MEFGAGKCFLYSLILSFFPFSISIPFIVLHGLGDICSNGNVETMRSDLSDLSKSQGFCVEVGDGSRDSWLKPLTEQVDIACDKVVMEAQASVVKQMQELQQGYNIVGQSQGNMIARGLIQFCDKGPPVRNYVSLAGPHAGITSIPRCGSSEICQLVAHLIWSQVYSTFVQNNVGPSGYIKLPNDISGYLSKSKFLPRFNNEVSNARNLTYKQRLGSLQNLVLVMFNNDTVLVPKETSWFGFPPDGSFAPVLPPQQTNLYSEDWIGLKTLDDGGKVKYISVPGDHLQIGKDGLRQFVYPYLTG